MKLPPSYMSLQPSVMLLPTTPSVKPLGVGIRLSRAALFAFRLLNTEESGALDAACAVSTAVLPGPEGQRATTAGVMLTTGGVELTTTVVVEGRLLQPPPVAVKVYVPPIAAVALALTCGLCCALVKPF